MQLWKKGVDASQGTTPRLTAISLCSPVSPVVRFPSYHGNKEITGEVVGPHVIRASLAPTASSAEASAAEAAPAHSAAEILRALLPLCTRLLLLLKAALRLVYGLPSVAAVLGPVAALPIVTIDVAVFAGVHVVIARRDTASGIRVVGEPASARGAFAAVDVARVPRASTGYNSCFRIVSNRSAATVGVTRVDVRSRAAPRDSYCAALRILKGGAAGGAIVARIRIGPRGLRALIGGITPAPVNVGAGEASVTVTPRRPPAASSVVAPWPPPGIVIRIVRISVGITYPYGQAPSSA
jgi:hypothetical protein